MVVDLDVVRAGIEMGHQHPVCVFEPDPVVRLVGFAVIRKQLCIHGRQRRAIRDLDEDGLIRDGKPAPILDHLAKLENRIMADLEALGLTPRSASELIDGARSADPFAELRAHLAAKRETNR